MESNLSQHPEIVPVDKLISLNINAECFIPDAAGSERRTGMLWIQGWKFPPNHQIWQQRKTQIDCLNELNTHAHTHTPTHRVMAYVQSCSRGCVSCLSVCLFIHVLICKVLMYSHTLQWPYSWACALSTMHLRSAYSIQLCECRQGKPYYMHVCEIKVRAMRESMIGFW